MLLNWFVVELIAPLSAGKSACETLTDWPHCTVCISTGSINSLHIADGACICYEYCLHFCV